MKGLKTILGVVSVITLLSLEGKLQAIDTAPENGATAAAQLGVRTFEKIISGENADKFGFSFRGDSPRLQGDPLRIVVIPSDRLKNFPVDNDNPEQLLLETDEFIYPIHVGGKVQSSLSVRKISGEKNWTTTSYAPEDDLAELYVRYRKPDSFIVQVPVLKIIFLGDFHEGKLFLTPMVDLSQFNLQAGIASPAKDVIRKIQSAAKSGPVGLDKRRPPRQYGETPRSP